MFSEAVNIWMQQVPVPGVDIFFYWITVLGSEFAYLFLVTTVLWCVDHRVGKRLLFAILPSTWINSVLKDALGMPRPSDEILRVMVDEWSAGFPSGHAQLAATFWGFLALCRRNRLMTIIAVSMVIMVSLSRLYLGVHYMYQVLGGIAVGVAVAWLAVRHPLSMAKSFQPKARHWLLGVLLPYLAALPVQSDDGFRIAGATMGLLLGEMTQHTQKDSGESLRPGSSARTPGAWLAYAHTGLLVGQSGVSGAGHSQYVGLLRIDHVDYGRHAVGVRLGAIGGDAARLFHLVRRIRNGNIPSWLTCPCLSVGRHPQSRGRQWWRFSLCWL